MNEEKSFTVTGYLVIEATKRNTYSSVYDGKIIKVTQGKPSINNRQICVAVHIKVPNAFFERLTPVIEIELPSEAVVNPNLETVIKLSALEVADKLELDVTDVEDGLRTLIKQKAHPLHTIENNS